jgi:hypothetical protein
MVKVGNNHAKVKVGDRDHMISNGSFDLVQSAVLIITIPSVCVPAISSVCVPTVRVTR